MTFEVGVYRHYKGNEYYVIGLAQMATKPSTLSSLSIWPCTRKRVPACSRGHMASSSLRSRFQMEAQDRGTSKWLSHRELVVLAR